MAEQTFDRAPARPLASIDRFSPGVLLPLAALFGLLGQYLFYGVGLGLNFGLATALLLGIAWLLRPVGAHVHSLDRWIAPAAIAFGFAPAVRSDPMLLLFGIPVTAALVAMASVSFAGVPLTSRAADLLVALGVVIVGKLLAGGAVLLAALPDLTRPLARRGGGRIVSVGVGLTLALPFLAVFAALFSSADAVFRSALTNLFDFDRWSIGDLIGRALLATTLGWLAGGIFLVAGRGADTNFPPVLPRLRGLVSSTAATTMLIALDAMFLFFVGLQVAYLFGGVDTLNATGLSYSEYARRGFFELINVAVLAGAIVFGVELVVARRTKLFVIAALILVAATLVVVISAAYRMQLYQLAYGWTEQRFYALAGIVWLGGSAVLAAALIWRNASRWLLHAAAIAGLVVTLGAAAVGPTGFVARQNLERVVDPSGLPADAYRGLDIYYLGSLGDGAIPTILEYLPRLENPWRELLGSYMRTYVLESRTCDECVNRLEPGPWQAFNVDRERARVALRDAAEDLRRYPAWCSPRGICQRVP
jgi:hypothetical protein